MFLYVCVFACLWYGHGWLVEGGGGHAHGCFFPTIFTWADDLKYAASFLCIHSLESEIAPGRCNQQVVNSNKTATIVIITVTV